MSVDGILIVNKPEGKTSFNTVAKLKRLTREKHVGHSGTLDPLATGVLPVCFGQATRVVQFLMDSNKSYLASIELGMTTDTFDRDGEITCQADAIKVTKAEIESALVTFQGFTDQLPPVYSALKYKGKRYYELARAGIHVVPKPRRVKIYSIELVDYQLPLLTIKVECGKGTYIRSLAHDLGQLLGCGAYLKDLIRVQCGPFDIKDALSLSEIEEAFTQGTWKELLYPVDSPLLNWKAVIVDQKDELAIRNGCSLPLCEEHPLSGDYCRAYGSEGNFIAVLRFIPDKKLWHPEKVFALQ
jgi:tRNA pseudouridine55 synthase